jgi:hypothetical protein
VPSSPHCVLISTCCRYTRQSHHGGNEQSRPIVINEGLKNRKDCHNSPISGGSGFDDEWLVLRCIVVCGGLPGPVPIPHGFYIPCTTYGVIRYQNAFCFRGAGFCVVPPPHSYSRVFVAVDVCIKRVLLHHLEPSPGVEPIHAT